MHGEAEIKTQYPTQHKLIAVYEHSDLIADACIIDKTDMLNDFVSATVKCEVNSHVYV